MASDEKQLVDCRIGFRAIAEFATQPAESQETEFFVFQPPEGQTPKKAPVGLSKCGVLRATLLQTPKHQLVLMVQALPSFVVSAISLALAWAQMRLILGTAPRYDFGQYSLTMARVFDRYLADEGVGGLLVHQLFRWSTLCGGCPHTVLLAFQWRVSTYKSIYMKAWLGQISIWLLYCVQRYYAAGMSCRGARELVACFDITFNVLDNQYIPSTLGISMITGYFVALEVRCYPWKVFHPAHVVGAASMYAFFLTVVPHLLSASDGIKFLFAVMINPAVNELYGILTRISARCCRNNHHTTSWQLIALAVLLKKLYARFIIGSIKQTSMVITTSVFLGIVELIARTTMPLRDGFMYRRAFKPYIPADKNPVALMTNVRSRYLRAETEGLEALTDLVYLTNNVMWPLLLKVSLNGKTAPSAGALLRKSAIQLALEMSMDLGICLYMAVVQNYHLLTSSTVKCKYWSFIVSAHVAMAIVFLNIVVLPLTVCFAPSLKIDGADMVMCSATLAPNHP
mmetsp:Transcript_63853/g.144091  ORF Transcript_63853/g.144091 Transcript_63853/m.144091 type:complete len:512 (-) Transcript_63853:31-1566(-)|eukprot:CAMPEP_0197886226 /NCGR_PEP_ID=MMETSP1439-20131203/15910_1 /TAXON_ID=66791 /ORGANISM="Gonyaulax spinifera, Strain CCMP409" /LENGTH=511 /DNA_ID=CAMNT_0043505993 /DNA_START=61 /DNA_END=1596 /DNA_ORIENTATION=-